MASSCSLPEAHASSRPSRAEGLQPWWYATAVDPAHEGVSHASAAACSAPGLRQEPCALAGLSGPQGGHRLAFSRAGSSGGLGASPPRVLLRPSGWLGPCPCRRPRRPAPVASERRGRPSSTVGRRSGFWRRSPMLTPADTGQRSSPRSVSKAASCWPQCRTIRSSAASNWRSAQCPMLYTVRKCKSDSSCDRIADTASARRS